MNLTVAEAKKAYQLGTLTEFVLTNTMNEGWWLFFNTERGAMPTLVDARTKQPRCFATLDAAINTAREIGFKANNLSCSN